LQFTEKQKLGNASHNIQTDHYKGNDRIGQYAMPKGIYEFDQIDVS
jgi:hypothetical protein